MSQTLKAESQLSHLGRLALFLSTQRIVIYYNCIGAFTIPEHKDIPDVDVQMETRKGVADSYAPAKIA